MVRSSAKYARGRADGCAVGCLAALGGVIVVALIGAGWSGMRSSGDDDERESMHTAMRYPATTGRHLIVWVVNDDRSGMAIALNDFRYAFGRKITFSSGTKAGYTPISLRTALARLLGGEEPGETRLPNLRVDWGPAAEPGKRSTGFAPTTCTIEFKFAPKHGLMRAWRPLFDSLARKGLAADESCSDDLRGEPPIPLAACDREWMDALGRDLRESGDRVLIVGPDDSDSVPALWFLLAGLDPKPTRYPATVSLRATSSLFDYEWRTASQEWEDWREKESKWSVPTGNSEVTGPNWYTSLGRMAGFCEDEFEHATECQKAQITSVVRAIEGPAQSFIQWVESDGILVDESLASIRGVQGFERIGILYPDYPQAKTPERSPKLSRLLYGPTLRLEYQANAAAAGAKILPSTYPNPPDSKAAADGWKDPAHLKALSEHLRPTLRFFRQSGVEAVGVFGDIDAKLPILQIVREELPQAKLFTSDADWHLEMPRSVDGGAKDDAAKGAAAGKDGKPARDGPPPFEGLIVFTNRQPDRRWVETQVAEIGTLRPDGDPILPDIFQFYTAHAVKRIFELVDFDRLDLLSRPEGVGELAKFLRSPSNLGRTIAGSNHGTDMRLRDSIAVMLIRDGKLGALGDPDHRLQDWCVVLLLSLILFVLFRAPDVPPRLRQITPAYYVFRLVNSLGRRARRVRPMEPGYFTRGRKLRLAWEQFSHPETLFSARVITVYLAAVLVALWVDSEYLSRSVSWSPWPDGHSLLPSLFLAGLACVIAHHLPYRFSGGLSRQGLIRRRRRRDDFAESWVLRRFTPPFSPWNLENQFDTSIESWIRRDIFPNLKLSRREAVCTAALALLLTAIDGASGFPIPPGVTYGLLLVGEFALFWLTTATAWTLFQVALMPDKLRGHLERTPDLRLAYLDISSVTRMGSIFIETISYFLIVYGLLMVARLPTYGMARWRSLRLAEIPWGAFLAAAGLAFLLGYWLYCYTSLKGLIGAVKRDRLNELEQLRRTMTRRLQPEGTVPSAEEQETAREKLKQLADEFEKQRRAVEEAPEEPWRVNASWRAWLALALILLPPLLSNLFGGWSDALMRTMRTLIGAA